MDKKEKELKKDLIEATKAVKRKFQELHSDKLSFNEHLEEKYRPITKSLKKIIKNQTNDNHLIEEKKSEVFNEDSYDSSTDDTFVEANNAFDETPKRVKRGVPNKINFDVDPSRKDIVTDDDDDDIVNEDSIDWHKYNSVLLSRKSDTQFGVRRSGKQLKIGNSVVKINGDKLLIQQQKFPITTGLLDLLFYKRPPSGYTTKDLEHYKRILLLTNAHKKFFEEDMSVRNSRKSYKYTHIISPILRSGSGIQTDFMTVNYNPIDYTYWDNPNELVDRLRLLISSSSAGHTGHNNEIISIIEELKEANIIE